MIKYKEMMMLSKSLESIKCDVCHKTFSIGIFNDELEIQEFQHIDFVGSFNSVFGDMNRATLDICQHCLKERLGDVMVIHCAEDKPEETSDIEDSPDGI